MISAVNFNNILQTKQNINCKKPVSFGMKLSIKNQNNFLESVNNSFMSKMTEIVVKNGEFGLGSKDLKTIEQTKIENEKIRTLVYKFNANGFKEQLENLFSLQTKKPKGCIKLFTDNKAKVIILEKGRGENKEVCWFDISKIFNQYNFPQNALITVADAKKIAEPNIPYVIKIVEKNLISNKQPVGKNFSPCLA
jgi:hypothetical protein